MSVISIDTAMQHLKAEEDDSSMVQVYLDAAEDSAARFMGRYFFATTDALQTAKALQPQRRTLAREAYALAKGLADSLSDTAERESAYQRAVDDLGAVLADADMVSDGIVVAPSITAACLLITSHLFSNREDVVTGMPVAALPLGSRSMLHQYRIGLGV